MKVKSQCRSHYKSSKVILCKTCNLHYCQCELATHVCNEILVFNCHSCGGNCLEQEMDPYSKIFCNFCQCNCVSTIYDCQDCGKEFSPWNNRLSCDDCQFVKCKVCSKVFPDEFKTEICCGTFEQ